MPSPGMGPCRVEARQAGAMPPVDNPVMAPAPSLRTACMSTPADHYERLLGPHYTWMSGLPYEARVV